MARELWEPGQAQLAVTKGALFNTLNLVEDPGVLVFLAERVKQEPKLKEQLFAWIEASKENAAFQIAAANALTILVRAKVMLSRKDFKGIQASWADLSYGVFDQTQFEGADLTGVNFRGAWLREANLQKAKLADTNFGELPSLELGDAIITCGYSPDGNWLVVGVENNIQLYQAKTLELLQTLEGHSDVVINVSFSPDRVYLASGSWDKTVKLWRLESGQWKYDQTLEGHSDKLGSVHFSPDGKYLASGSWDRTVKVWRLESRQWKYDQTLDVHSDAVRNVNFSPDGAHLASVSLDSVVRVWRLKSEKWEYDQTLDEDHDNQVTCVDFSLDGVHLACGGWNGIVRIWRLENGRWEVEQALRGHSDAVSSVKFSLDGVHLASGSGDRAVKLWRLEEGGRWRSSRPLKGIVM